MNYYFDPINSPIITLVSSGHNTRPCPFSGRYTLSGLGGSMSALMSGQLNCHQGIMHAGCSASDDLIVESVCSRNLEDNVRTKWSCHGRWTTDDDRQMLVLSTPIFEGQQANFVCLTYTDREGILTASASMNSCQFSSHNRGFNITSSGPCLQALTGASGPRLGPQPSLGFVLGLLVLVVQKILRL